MASFAPAINLLRARLESQFTALPLYWPNDDREPSLKEAPNGFVYSEARVADEKQISLGIDGARYHRDYGEFNLVVYVPKKTRVGTAETYADQLRAIFGANSIDGINVTRKLVGNGEPVDGPLGKWYAVPVTIEWHSDRVE